jgi:hypothetical protein
MVTVTSMDGVRLHHYSYYYKWHEVRWLVIPTNGMKLDGYSDSYEWYEAGWLQLFLRMT